MQQAVVLAQSSAVRHLVYVLAGGVTIAYILRTGLKVYEFRLRAQMADANLGLLRGFAALPTKAKDPVGARFRRIDDRTLLKMFRCCLSYNSDLMHTTWSDEESDDDTDQESDEGRGKRSCSCPSCQPRPAAPERGDYDHEDRSEGRGKHPSPQPAAPERSVEESDEDTDEERDEESDEGRGKHNRRSPPQPATPERSVEESDEDTDEESNEGSGKRSEGDKESDEVSKE
jgi:hypothetical protein